MPLWPRPTAPQLTPAGTAMAKIISVVESWGTLIANARSPSGETNTDCACVGLGLAEDVELEVEAELELEVGLAVAEEEGREVVVELDEDEVVVWASNGCAKAVASGQLTSSTVRDGSLLLLPVHLNAIPRHLSLACAR